MDPVFQVGKGGVGETLVKTVVDALEARELIKLSVLETSSDGAREVADELSRLTGADVVGVIGRRLILFRESSKQENKKFSLEIRGMHGKKRTVL